MTVPSATRPASSTIFGPRTPRRVRHGCGRMIEGDSAQPHIPASTLTVSPASSARTAATIFLQEREL